MINAEEARALTRLQYMGSDDRARRFVESLGDRIRENASRGSSTLTVTLMNPDETPPGHDPYLDEATRTQVIRILQDQGYKVQVTSCVNTRRLQISDEVLIFLASQTDFRPPWMAVTIEICWA